MLARWVSVLATALATSGVRGARSARHLRARAGYGAVLAGLLVLAAPAAATGRAPAAASPNPSSDVQLDGVSAVSSGDAWAVGYYENEQEVIKTLILHWDGTAWTQMPSPSPSSVTSELTGVSADSPSDAWAVGYYQSNASGAPDKALILHWNGTAWTKAPIPLPGTGSRLTGVSADSPSDAWAVGVYSRSSTSGSANPSLILHWDGTAWTKVASPSPSTSLNFLSGVSADSPGDAWAAGYYQSNTSGVPDPTLILHWNGTAWTQVASPSPGSAYGNDTFLSGVSADSPSDAWAVGMYQYKQREYETLILHWDGTAWTQVASPSRSGGSFLYGVSADSGSDAWAVGRYASGTTYRTLILHWNGTAWTQVPSPSPGGVSGDSNELYGVSADSASDAWAVGYHQYTSTHTLILHWTGTAWVRT